jgi:hypothetical protein
MPGVIEGALGELAEAWCPCDDFAHPIRSNFVSAELEKFTGNALNFAHTQTKPHQLAAERHQAATHQSGQPAAARGFNGRFRAWNFIDKGLNLIGGTFAAKETQNDADGLARNSLLNAGLCSQLLNQLVHMPRLYR